ncbi:MAG: ATP-binding protein, partial [Planctomycetota bacterium]|nr:ATP-binding protein [Planctomycetota bacterium]
SPGGQLLGTFGTYRPYPHTPDAEEVRVLETAADLAGIVMERSDSIERLSRQEAQLRLFVEHAPAAVAMLDRELRYIVASRRWIEDYGLEHERIIGRSHYDVFPEIPQEWRDIHQRCLAGEQISCEEDRFVRASGEVQWIRWAVHPWLEAGGAIGGIVMFTEDVSERKQQQEAILDLQRRARERAEQELAAVRDELISKTRLAALGQLSGSVAHELRNPLGAIRNAIYLLRKRVPKSEPQAEEYISLIAGEVNNADRIISDLLEMARTKTPSRERVDLSRLCDDAFRRANPSDDVVCRVETADDDTAVWADPSMLRQVFENLMRNAIQAMDGVGEIRVSHARRGEMDEILIEDTGPGVAPADLKRLFEPLFTTRAKGTGLGLTICRQIVERHGGAIDCVEAPSGRGAAFRITVPSMADDPAHSTEAVTS